MEFSKDTTDYEISRIMNRIKCTRSEAMRALRLSDGSLIEAIKIINDSFRDEQS